MAAETSSSTLPSLPDEFAAYKAEILATIKDTIRLRLKSSDTLKPWDSKVGGLPYFPKEEEMDYPKGKKSGFPLLFLAQINFEDMPKLNGYPEKGIVQFYIDSDDDVMGMDFENPRSQQGSRVLFFENIIKTEIDLLAKCPDGSSNDYSPIQKGVSYAIEFLPEKQYITENDYRFYNLQLYKDDKTELMDKYQEFSTDNNMHGHRIGGYPYFTQEDPRMNEELQNYELLFQLDTEYSEEDGVNIMWGDAGVGGFFIDPKDLEQKNFQNVLYNWDCC